MGGFTDKWFQRGKGDGLTQKVYDRVKPEQPLKPKIDEAQKKLQLQVQKLESIQRKLQEKDNYIFKRVVEAVRVRNEPYSRAYAAELHEIRKMNNMVTSAKLSLEQIQIRLNTMSELGDVVVTLSPCMSILKGLGTNLGGIIPEANSSMQDLSDTLGEIMSGASVSQQHEDMTDAIHDSGSQETKSILDEASSILEGQIRNKIPDIPQEFSTKSGQPPAEKVPQGATNANAVSNDNALATDSEAVGNDKVYYDPNHYNVSNSNGNSRAYEGAASTNAVANSIGMENDYNLSENNHYTADVARNTKGYNGTNNFPNDGNGNHFGETKISNYDSLEQLVQKNQYYNDLRRKEKQEETASSIFTA